MRIISPAEKVSQITCDCSTVFEYDKKDIGYKGDYGYCYFVHCPSCDKEHVLNLTNDEEHEVHDYVQGCKSCRGCKYFAVIKEGYSSYTVTNISISCRMDNNPRMPLTGYESGGEKEYAYAFAENCNEYKAGANYEKDVEESEKEAYIRWEKSNNRYNSY